MTILLAELDRWATACDRAADDAQEAAALLAMGRTDDARRLLLSSAETTRELRRSLALAGASAAEVQDAPRPVPLTLLSTERTRALLSRLREAQEVAEAVDAERGNVLPASVPLQPGESRGTGWAETISNLAERLRVEVEGPRGRGEGSY